MWFINVLPCINTCINAILEYINAPIVALIKTIAMSINAYEVGKNAWNKLG